MGIPQFPFTGNQRGYIVFLLFMWMPISALTMLTLVAMALSSVFLANFGWNVMSVMSVLWGLTMVTSINS